MFMVTEIKNWDPCENHQEIVIPYKLSLLKISYKQSGKHEIWMFQVMLVIVV